MTEVGSRADDAGALGLATARDVIVCYRTFLGREPESDAVVAHHLKSRLPVSELATQVYDSLEARRRRVDEACALIDSFETPANAIEVGATSSDTTRLTSHVEQVWSRYGREEAFYSVLTNPKYLRADLGRDDIDEFYATGEHEIEHLDRVLRRNGVTIDNRWSVLELGCGVGRMAEAFARRCRIYNGVDISAAHLDIARQRLEARVIANGRFRLLADYLADRGYYNLFYSLIVLQHNPPPIMDKLLSEALSGLAPGGYAYFQVPCHLYDYKFSVADYLTGTGREDIMEMHALPQRYIFARLAEHGLTPLEVTPNARIGPLGHSYGFLARKAA